MRAKHTELVEAWDSERSWHQTVPRRIGVAAGDGEPLEDMLADAHDTIRWLRCELEVSRAYAKFVCDGLQTVTDEQMRQADLMATMEARIACLARCEVELQQRRSMPRYVVADAVNAALRRVPVLHRFAKLGLSWIYSTKPRG